MTGQGVVMLVTEYAKPEVVCFGDIYTVIQT
jgi:hypothetical protein